MKKYCSTVIYSFIIFLTFFISSCDSNNFETGVHGIIEYGSGDCTQPVETRVYEKYSGDLYFVQKEKLDTMSSTNFLDLFAISTVVTISNGKLRTELVPGTYVIMIKDYYYKNTENTITIIDGVISEKNIQFYECTN
ncbi:MAG: hypothetical protein A2W91_02280 [Bacteroidetes bacterium GWF2_38_335]|nr:MAG: hypothetical protein A2W91_02280 [Bacteroidetes bacterium GWF2_38_335]OFY80679.1 MAG: hypothetical protein A2281_05295 [Bacteroidetes bacterium RIFOXYA12_FULL_38_20]HBS87022.1 hypothetical protein [Bacteroidales bacterium]